MKEATKAIHRRGKEYNDVLFVGEGIDIGAGPDCISYYGYEAYNWDMKDGDAMLMASLEDNSQDFVHSSHCLEHMVDPKIAMKNWVRICKPNGYLVVMVPEEELYEHCMWPSRFNSDHKWSFRIYRNTPLHAKSLNILDTLKFVWREVDIISIKLIEERFNRNLDKSIDQTAYDGGPECAIEMILRKR